MKVISFIGTADYKETEYFFPDGKKITTPYFPFAANQVYNPDGHYIFMTDDAKLKHYHKLSDIMKFNEVNIPFGKNEDEFWEIFDDLIQCVEEKDELIIDFTYGFRSQSILIIAALIFLKALRNVKITKILYGAFEAKDENGITPVFDLSSFIELIDWSYAVHDFINYSKAEGLCKLMTKIQKKSFNNKNLKPPEGLRKSALELINISKSLSLVNTTETFEYANSFSKNIGGLINDLGNIRQTKPLGLLLSEISKRIEPISSAERNLFNDKGINAQLNILQWYLETGQYQQAITLMNELFITINCIKKSIDPLELKNRTDVSEYFGSRIQLLKDKKLEPEFKDETTLWNRLSETRNEINHAGMKKNQSKTDSLVNNIIKLFDDLNNYIKK